MYLYDEDDEEIEIPFTKSMTKWLFYVYSSRSSLFKTHPYILDKLLKQIK